MEHRAGARRSSSRLICLQRPTTNEIATVSGHRTLTEIARYTSAASQERLAEQAMGRIAGERRLQVPPI
jgi:hypothetical protein